MSQRKQYVVDKKFQFRTTFSIIGLVTIITAFIITAIAINIVNNNSKMENIQIIEDNIVQFLYESSVQKKLQMNEQDLKDKKPDLGKKTDDELRYNQARRTVFLNHVNNLKTLKNIIKYNKILLIVLILSVLFQGIILYILLIRKTHKISGPIFVMSNYMKEILEGKVPQFRKLREKDELKDFYELFQKMVENKFK